MKENRLSQIDYYPLSTTSTRLTTSNIPNFITAQKLLEDKFSIEISKKDKKKRLELAIGDKVCFVKPHSDLIYHTLLLEVICLKDIMEVWNLLLYMF